MRTTSAQRMKKLRERKRQDNPNFSKAEADRKKQIREAKGEAGKRADAERRKELRKSKGDIGKKADAERKRQKRAQIKTKAIENLSTTLQLPREENMIIEENKELPNEDKKEKKSNISDYFRTIFRPFGLFHATVLDDVSSTILKNNLFNQNIEKPIINPPTNFQPKYDKISLYPNDYGQYLYEKRENDDEFNKLKQLSLYMTYFIETLTHVIIAMKDSKLKKTNFKFNQQQMNKLKSDAHVLDKIENSSFSLGTLPSSATFLQKMLQTDEHINETLLKYKKNQTILKDFCSFYDEECKSLMSNTTRDIVENPELFEQNLFKRNEFDLSIDDNQFLHRNNSEEKARYLKKEKIITFSISPNFDETEQNDFQKKICKKVNVKSCYFNAEKNEYEIKITGDIFSWTRTGGIFETHLKGRKIFKKTTEILTISDDFINKVTHQKNKLLDILETILSLLIKQAHIPNHVIDSVLMSLWEYPDQTDKIKAIRSKLKNLKKNKRHAKHQFSSIMLFEEESLLKAKIEINKTNIFIYYSDIVRNYLKNNNFDILFLDGTHLNTNDEKNQMLMFRLYSSSLNEVVTAVYAICDSKLTDIYLKIVEHIYKTGIFDNLKYVMTDYELAFKKAFQTINNKTQTLNFRFCYFHLTESLKKCISSINKMIRIHFSTREFLNATESPENDLKHAQCSKNLAVFFSFLAFIPKENVCCFFYLWTAIAIRIFGNKAGVIFFCKMFFRNYIKENGRFSENFFINFDHYRFITNNFVEGSNSGLKKQINGYKTESNISIWLKTNSKITALNLGSKVQKSKLTTDYCVRFQSAFIKGEYEKMLPEAAEKIMSMGNHKKVDDTENRINETLMLKKITIRKKSQGRFVLTIPCTDSKDQHYTITGHQAKQYFEDIIDTNQIKLYEELYARK